MRFVFDARFVAHEHDLWALGEYRSTIEAQLEYLRAQDEVRTMAELVELGLSDDDASRSGAWQRLDDRAERIHPRLFRGPYLVSLWGCYEATFLNVAESIAHERKTPLQHKDIRGESALSRAKKYFEDYLGIAFESDARRGERIADLYVMRNAFAHANGLLKAHNADRQNKIAAVVRRNPTILLDSGFVIPSAEYIDAAYQDVNSSARDLIGRVRGGPAFHAEGID